jgi:hypothetical protein
LRALTRRSERRPGLPVFAIGGCGHHFPLDLTENLVAKPQCTDHVRQLLALGLGEGRALGGTPL